MTNMLSLPVRAGKRPRTTPTNPHTQLDQQPVDSTLRDELARRAFALQDVEERPSRISVPGRAPSGSRTICRPVRPRRS